MREYENEKMVNQKWFKHFFDDLESVKEMEKRKSKIEAKFAN